MMKAIQKKIDFSVGISYERDNILENLADLILMHKTGLLGGEKMPEDSKPSVLSEESKENYHFLTLPMSLNYQRNSYTLWKSAANAFADDECKQIFDPFLVAQMTDETLRNKLLKHKVGLQPNKHTQTWKRICVSISELYNGDIRNMFRDNDNDVDKIRHVVQIQHKQRFPYLSGDKIFNYWLYVMEQYTPTKFKNRSSISVAPDTHVIQASLVLGLVTGELEEIAKKRTVISDKWKEILEGTGISPIDIHTPLWLWSKAGFPQIIKKSKLIVSEA